MSSAPAAILPLAISIAPFPEGFQGDMDETFQQACILMEAYIEGNFLTGLILPPGSTLPTSDQGPIAMGGTWYFWDSGSGQYEPQSVPIKVPKNCARNPVYQVAQNGTTFTPGTGLTALNDMAQARLTAANLLAVAADTGPPAGPDNDYIPTSIKYTVSTALTTLAASDLFVHEHLIEGSDLLPLQGQTLSLAFSVYAGQTGIYSVYLTSSGRDQSYVFSFQVPVANSWQRVKVQGIPALPTAGTWHFGDGQTGLYIGVVMAVGTQWQTTQTASWQGAFVAGTSSNSNMLAAAANSLKITGVKLEASTACTPLSVAPFGDDFNAVQRYFLTNFNYGVTNAGTALVLRAPSAGTWLAEFLFAQRMCKIPTVTPFGYQSYASGHITNMASGSAVDIAVASILATRKGIFDTEPVGTGSGGVTPTGTVTALTFNVTTTTGQSTLTNVTAAEAQYVLPGATISGAGIPAGATVLSYNPGAQALYISAPATASGANITMTVASPIIGSLSTMAGIAIGQTITGTGVPAGTTVVGILSANSIQASNPIAAGSATFTIGAAAPINKNDLLLCFFEADARLS